jgi:hypothetical protein
MSVYGGQKAATAHGLSAQVVLDYVRETDRFGAPILAQTVQRCGDVFRRARALRSRLAVENLAPAIGDKRPWGRSQSRRKSVECQ